MVFHEEVTWFVIIKEYVNLTHVYAPVRFAYIGSTEVDTFRFRTIGLHMIFFGHLKDLPQISSDGLNSKSERIKILAFFKYKCNCLYYILLGNASCFMKLPTLFFRFNFLIPLRGGINFNPKVNTIYSKLFLMPPPPHYYEHFVWHFEILNNWIKYDLLWTLS